VSSILESSRCRKEPSSIETQLPRLSLGELISVEGLTIELPVLTELLALVNGGDGAILSLVNGGDGGLLSRENCRDGSSLSCENGRERGLLSRVNGGVGDLLSRPRGYLAIPVL
jgi:hypothetical protein